MIALSFMDKTTMFKIINGLILIISFGVLIFAYCKNRNRIIKMDPNICSKAWERSVAAIIDLVLLNLIFVVFPYIPGKGIELAAWIENLLILVFTWLYFSTLESSKFQGSIGKLCQGIQVVDQFGNKINFLKATIRFYAKFFSFYSLFIGFLIFPFTKYKQALHDMLATTIVTKKTYK
jgi:uncharacterized RDD family membrane protein YckC